MSCAQATPQTHAPASIAAARKQLVARALQSGAEALDPASRSRLLNDPLALSALHFAVWTTAQAHPSWRL